MQKLLHLMGLSLIDHVQELLFSVRGPARDFVETDSVASIRRRSTSEAARLVDLIRRQIQLRLHVILQLILLMNHVLILRIDQSWLMILLPTGPTEYVAAITRKTVALGCRTR